MIGLGSDKNNLTKYASWARQIATHNEVSSSKLRKKTKVCFEILIFYLWGKNRLILQLNSDVEDYPLDLSSDFKSMKWQETSRIFQSSAPVIVTEVIRGK